MDEHTVTMFGGPLKDGPELTKWGPFDLIERVGQGGFGDVYRAFDSTLQREVAVKLLRDSSGQKSDDLLREARAMARVEHQNIIKIYGVNTYEGRAGFWSAFVRGKTLSAWIAQNGPFGAREVAHIGVDLCSALSAVHAAGLLHRDVKTSNAMREEGGRILLMDFGLTESLHQQTIRGGTPGYLAPELMRGQNASICTDIYAMGVLLYNLLTGKYPSQEERPAGGGDTWTLLDARPDLPPALVKTIHKALERDPANRFSSASQMAAALSDAGIDAGIVRPPAVAKVARWKVYAAGAAAVVVLGAGAYGTRAHWLPRDSGGAHAIHERYEQAHDLIEHYYRPKAVEDAIQMLEGIVREDPGFAAGFADLGRANFLQFAQLRDQKYAEPAHQASLEAISLDTNLANAHVTLALLYTQQGRYDLAAQEIDTALKLDKTSADAWAAKADLYFRQGRTEEVEALLQKAVDLAPSSWQWPNQLATFLESTGHTDKAIDAEMAAIRLSPDNARAYGNLAIHLMSAGKLREAEAALNKSISILPIWGSYVNLGLVQEQLGDYDGAVHSLNSAIAQNPNDYHAWGALASVYGQRGDSNDDVVTAYRKSIELGEKLRASRPRDATLIVDIAVMYARVGDYDQALPLAKQAAALEPDNANVQFRAGLACEMAHHRPEALTFIGEALKHGYPMKAVEADPGLADLCRDQKFLAMKRSLR